MAGDADGPRSAEPAASARQGLCGPETGKAVQNLPVRVSGCGARAALGRPDQGAAARVNAELGLLAERIARTGDEVAAGDLSRTGFQGDRVLAVS